MVAVAAQNPSRPVLNLQERLDAQPGTSPVTALVQFQTMPFWVAGFSSTLELAFNFCDQGLCFWEPRVTTAAATELQMSNRLSGRQPVLYRLIATH